MRGEPEIETPINLGGHGIPPQRAHHGLARNQRVVCALGMGLVGRVASMGRLPIAAAPTSDPGGLRTDLRRMG